MRLLAVDDDDSILELLSEILISFGYSDVVTATSGVEALQVIATAEKPFDCLLLDIQMPQMNGITLCDKVRQISGYQYVPIIMLTAMVQKRYIDDAFEAGATDYVTKPFDFLDLKKRLSDAQRLAAERQASIAAILEMEELNGQVSAQQSFDLSEPLQIDGVHGCVGFAEFENYVHQMSRARLLDSTLLAVKIDNIAEYYTRLSFADFSQLVANAVKLISQSVHGKGNLVSYRGDGLFLMIRHNKDAVDGLSFARELQSRFVSDPAIDSETLAPSFIVGNEIQLKSVDESAVESSLTLAIDSVVGKKKETDSELLVFPKTKPAPADQASPDPKPAKRGYRFLLGDILHSDRRKRQAVNGNGENDHEIRVRPGSNTQ